MLIAGIIWWLAGYIILLYAEAKVNGRIKGFHIIWSLFAAIIWPFFLMGCVLEDVVFWEKRK